MSRGNVLSVRCFFGISSCRLYFRLEQAHPTQWSSFPLDNYSILYFFKFVKSFLKNFFYKKPPIELAKLVWWLVNCQEVFSVFFVKSVDVTYTQLRIGERLVAFSS